MIDQFGFDLVDGGPLAESRRIQADGYGACSHRRAWPI